MSKKKVVCTECEVQENKKSKKQRNAKVAKTAALGTVLGLCASAIVGLSVSLYFVNRTVRTHESYQRQMDAMYFRAYYDLLDGANDLGMTLRKIGASDSPTMQQSLLYEVWSAAELAENSLGVFDSHDDGVMKAQKFVNQLGDYSHALALRVADGQPLSDGERQTLVKLGDVADVYLKALEQLRSSVDEGKLFVGEDGMLDSFAGAFGQFAEPSFAYPEMIYDGPFSDALEAPEQLALGGDEIDSARGAEIVAKLFEGFGASDIMFTGEGGGNIATLNYSLKVGGNDAFVQLTKRGGRPLSFSSYVEGEEVAALVDASMTCQQRALSFLSRMGFEDMQVVWSSSADGECVVNLAPVQQGVILYPDLVKVKISEDGGVVTGMDATHYAYNHRERNLPAPAIDKEQAAKSLRIPPIDEGRPVLIPLRGTREALTYEFECHDGEDVYFIYIDAISGDEANILYVIDDDGMGMRTA